AAALAEQVSRLNGEQENMHRQYQQLKDTGAMLEQQLVLITPTTKTKKKSKPCLFSIRYFCGPPFFLHGPYRFSCEL
ncbi:hypothetical protein ABTF76_22690, partial [Acinetobacter baumannii]